VPPSAKSIVSAAEKKMPVLVSPVVVIAGSKAVPATKAALCDVSIVIAVVEPLVASCNTPEVSPAMLSAVPDVVPAEIIDAMYFPL
jgi:hypothetical protein